MNPSSFLRALLVPTFLLAGLAGCGGGDDNLTTSSVSYEKRPPTNIKATATSSKITITWTNVPGAYSHVVYYSLNSDFSKTSAGVTKQVVSRVYSGVDLYSPAAGKTYYYAVSSSLSSNGSDDSALSDIYSVKVPNS